MKQKINIMKAGPSVTEHEINRFMDFEGLLKLKEQSLKRGRTLHRVRKVFLLIITFTILSGVLVLREYAERRAGHPVNAREKITSALALRDSVTSNPDRVRTDVSPSNATVDVIVAQPQSHGNAKAEDQKRKNPSLPKEERIATPPAYIQPEPVDGYEMLYAYFDRELRYPMIAAKDSVEGVVIVDFVIGADGNIKNITIENSLGDVFDQEIRRLFGDMPSWRPATYNGRPVDSKVSLPITFSLEDHTNP